MRTTLTFNDTLLRSLKMRAVQSDTTVSALVEEAVKQQLLEDLSDIELVDARKDEPVESFDVLVKQLKAEGLL